MGDTSMAQDAYHHSRTPGIILGFRGFNRSQISGIHVSFLDFGTSYVALFNGLMISDIRILVLHVYCLYHFFIFLTEGLVVRLIDEMQVSPVLSFLVGVVVRSGSPPSKTFENQECWRSLLRPFRKAIK